MNKYLNIILNTIFPLKCEVCRQQVPLSAGARICQSCRGKILLIGDYFCRKCGKSLQVETAFCVDCHRDDTLYYESIKAAGIYQGVLRESIHVFKYNRRSCLGPDLGEFMLSSYQKHFGLNSFDKLVPVPLHKKQYRQRQYNQSEVLAKNLSRATGIPVAVNVLARIRGTRPQFTLNRQERASNIRNAFQVKNRDWLKGSKVLVIDDICTTGSTINECARILKQAGAIEVHGLVLAHA
ncbi:MAG: ComF family protein [Elusimicrobia bacterium]|nr:ComF family protein [Elusimicrobiota bacterium]